MFQQCRFEECKYYIKCKGGTWLCGCPRPCNRYYDEPDDLQDEFEPVLEKNKIKKERIHIRTF